MDLQQHYEQVHQQWLTDQQQQQHNQQLYAQHLQQQNAGRTTPDLHRKRGLANESDEFMGIKKRNMGSEATAQGMFGFPETGADSPGSIMSTEGVGAQAQAGYFDQQPYFSGSSSAASSPHQGIGLYHQQQIQQANTSAPSTPATNLSSINNSNGSQSLLSRSPGSTSIWGSLAQGSHSSPPTPSVASITGRTTGMTANMVASNLMSGSSGADGGDLQKRLLEEQQQLHDAQQQEQQKLQMAQQWELEQMQQQQHQHEAQQAKARQQQQMQFQHSPPSAAPIHHDHNDPATWGSYNSVPAAVGGAGQFTGYLGGYGKGYTPASIGGVAALAAASAMAASRHTPTNGHRGDSGMDMDF
ncbi:hypothetical protein EC957_009490 [Mortierella hygrophila]|uniref:Uncharacterized protein n=1 Tax=Mortierella hygrophila TaxID=979708 RepID=A0A9P6FBY4_9FUNG|nr:hypothetical protein EC957_009490 [Mortierella hygrophila]